MEREKSADLCAYIQKLIVSCEPVCTPEEISGAGESSAALKGRFPFLADNADLRVQEVLNRFLSKFLILTPQAAFCGREAPFFHGLYRQARCLPSSLVTQDPYVRAVRVSRRQAGRFTLSMVSYEPYELFAFQEPYGSGLGEKIDPQIGPILVPRLGFFEEKVSFPAVYEDQIPWMSLCPSEILTMAGPVRKAEDFCQKRFEQTGRPCRVLSLGLGLGYFPFLLSCHPYVERVDSAEISEEERELFVSQLLAYFPDRAKIRVLREDAYELLHKVPVMEDPSCPPEGAYDYIFADTWESQADGAKDYQRLLRQKKRLGQNTGFGCWIEPQIRQYCLEVLGEDPGGL